FGPFPKLSGRGGGKVLTPSTRSWPKSVNLPGKSVKSRRQMRQDRRKSVKLRGKVSGSGGACVRRAAKATGAGANPSASAPKSVNQGAKASGERAKLFRRRRRCDRRKVSGRGIALFGRAFAFEPLHIFTLYLFDPHLLGRRVLVDRRQAPGA